MNMEPTRIEYGLGGTPGLANTTGNQRLKSYSSYENGLNLPPRDLTTSSTLELRLTGRQKLALESEHKRVAGSRLAFQEGLRHMPSTQVYAPVSMESADNYPRARPLVAPTLGRGPLPIIKEEKKARNIQGYLRRKALKYQRRIGVFLKGAGRDLAESFPQHVEAAVTGFVSTATNRFNALQDELDRGALCGGQVDNADHNLESDGGSEQRVRVKTIKTLKALQVEENIDDHIPENKNANYVDIPLPSFNKARAMRDKKTRRAYVSLTYYLKTKHFMHIKDPHHIRTLVQDARAWMIKNEFKMESFVEYCILTSAVAAAFFVDQEELAFRSRMKNRREWQALFKHNNACNGDLGYRFGGVEARFKTLRHLGKTNVHLPLSQLSP